MRDFTVKEFKQLLSILLDTGNCFQPFKEFLKNQKSKSVILRHDVDLLPQNSLQFAQIQNELGIKGTYYFRAVPESWDEAIIKEIHELGHEVGYHYENLTTCKGNLEAAIKDFETNLEKLRKLVPVSTICMHGSPRSPYDSKDLWKKYDYRDFGIVGEPYFDIDFSEVLYLTDTGRRWDGDKVSVRDKVTITKSADTPSGGRGERKELLSDNYLNRGARLSFKKTTDIIEAAENNLLPDKIMFTFHPQRWTNKPLPWMKELVWQNTKNIIKRIIVQRGQNNPKGILNI